LHGGEKTSKVGHANATTLDDADGQTDATDSKEVAGKEGGTSKREVDITTPNKGGGVHVRR